MTEQPDSILIVKTSAIGDVIQTFSVLEYLRHRFPQARIDWVAEEGIIPLLRAHPQIDHPIEIRTKVWRKALFSQETRSEFKVFKEKLRSTQYDLLFDLQGNTKSAIVTACAKAKIKVGFGWKSAREKGNCLVTTKRFDVPENLNIRLRYLHLVQGYFNDASEFFSRGFRLSLDANDAQRFAKICNDPVLQRRPRLMICFGSKWENKRLEVSTWSSFLQKVALDCDPSFVFIFGDDQEKRIAENLCHQFKDRALVIGNLSLPLWQNLMGEMDGVFAVDSAALHLCGTTLTPSLSVFGPSLAKSYKPIEARHVSFQGQCPYQRTFSSRCPILRTCPTGACIRQIQVDDLFSLFKQWAASQLNLVDYMNREK